MKKYIVVKALALCAAALCLTITSCRKDKTTDPNSNGEVLVIAPNINVYGLTQDGKLLGFNARSGGAVSGSGQVAVTGMQTGETMLAIDFRPATGELYGVSSGSRLYIINPVTGVARAVNSTPFTPAVDGAAVGFDFNPTVDRIRLVTGTGQNLRINPETGAVQTVDLAITGVSGAKITSVAYTGNTAGSAATTLYDIDGATKKLYKQDPPNDGKLVEVGSLGIESTEAADFDIAPDGTTALAAITVGGNQGFYVVDLTSGKSYKAATFQNKMLSLAIPVNPVAYAVSTNNELLIFNPANPVPVAKPISGLQANEIIQGIDFRPLNGQLYGLGSLNRLYTINTSSGVATAVGTTAFTTALSGTSFGFDFNPVADRIRVVSNTGQNLRLNPNDGTVAAVDGALTATGQFVNGAAYTNNFAGATTTVLYVINSATGKLYKQDPPNDGTLTEIGSLGVTIDAANGFDISSANGSAYALLTVGGTTRLYTINLTTGKADIVSNFPQTVRGFALGLGF